MKKIWQKSLASMISAALCLTAFVGCLTVNAATTYEGTITSDGVEVSETVESATVTLNISSPDAAMNVAAIAATTDYGTLTAVEVEGTNCKIDETKDLATGKFFVEAIDNVAGFNTAAVKLTFTKAENVAVGNYPVTITYFAGASAATWKEDIVNLTVEGAINIEVKSATITPVLDESITFFNRSAVIQDTLGVGYLVNKAAVSAYSSIEIVTTATKYDETRNKYVADLVVLNKSEIGSFYSATYTGIAMYELDLPVTTYIKCYDAEGNYVAYSNSVTDAPADLLKVTYNASTKDTFKTMVTDMLNLGAAAQTYFGAFVPGSDLASATLINDGWDQTYATTGDLAGLTIVNNLTWATDSPLSSADITISPSLNYAATPTLGYLIKDVNGTLNKADFSLTVSYDVQYPTAFAGTRSVTVSGDKLSTVGGFYTYAFSEITLADSDRTITATLSYQGSKVLTYEYSMDAGIQAKLSGSANIVALSDALARFEAAARAYFGSF